MNNRGENTIDVLNNLNNDIIKMYKDLKKELSQQKDGEVNEAILKKMTEIHRKTVELEEEVNTRLPNLTFDKKFVQIFERDGTPLEYYKEQKAIIDKNDELDKIKIIRGNARIALEELTKE